MFFLKYVKLRKFCFMFIQYFSQSMDMVFKVTTVVNLLLIQKKLSSVLLVLNELLWLLIHPPPLQKNNTTLLSKIWKNQYIWSIYFNSM